MGYCIQQRDNSFFIDKSNKQLALKAIKDLASKAHIKDSSGLHFMWVCVEDFINTNTLEQALDAWRWNTTQDIEGNINGIHFQGEKYGDDKILFQAIISYVKNGSFIEMQGEDGEIWRWTFNNGNFEEKYAKIVFN